MGMCKTNKLALALAGAAGLCVSASAFGQSDSCGTATAISNGTFAYDLFGATNEGNTGAACGATGTAEDLWWSYTSVGAGTLTVSTCGLATADTVLELYADCSGTQLACSDDFCGAQSTVSVPVADGQVVLIRIADFAGGTHAGTISVNGPGGPPPPPPPANDDCSTPDPVVDGVTYTFDTTQATPDGAGLGCAVGDASNSVWFSYTNPTAADLLVTASLCGSFYDTAAMAIDGCGGALLGCNDDGTCGLQSTLIYTAPAGSTTLIRVSGFGAAFGAGTMTISSVTPPSCDLTAPVGSQIEAEACGADANGGCNAGAAYESISCGNAVVFGSTWASGGTRDTDWYSFTQYGAGDVTATVNSELPMGVFLLDDACPPTFFGTAFSNDVADYCRDITVVGTGVPAGNVVIFASTTTATAAIFDGYPCGDHSDYILTVSTTGSCTPLGACCAPAGCSIMTQADCISAGGNYLGDDSVCETVGGFAFTAGTAAIEDISGTGTDLGLLDDNFANAPIGFTFNFYGTDYTDCYVASNGYISFGAGSSVFFNDAIPSAAIPNNALYTHWDDFNFDATIGGGGQGLYETRGTAGVDLRFIVQWNNVPQYGNTDSNTFQCVIFENGTVEYRYQTVPSDGDNTVGAENADGTIATSVDALSIVSGTSLTGVYGGGGSNCGSCAWQADGCFADYNNDGGIDGDDVIVFFGDWDQNQICADCDGSEGVDGDDVILFFSAWDGAGIGFPGCEG